MKIQKKPDRSIDEDYIASIYYNYIEDLFAWGNTFTHDKEMIKDCIQDLFAFLLDHRENLNDIQNLRVYLFSALRNNIIRMINQARIKRGEARLNDSIKAEVKDPSETIEEILIKHEHTLSKKRFIRHILQSLTPKQKRIILLRYSMQMDYEEICDVLALSYQSARTLIYRTIQKLREVCRENRMIN